MPTPGNISPERLNDDDLSDEHTRQRACALAERWIVDPRVLVRVCKAANEFKRETGRDVRIISGYRTREEQQRLEREGRPAAEDQLSTHRSCPATGVDVSLGFGVTQQLKAIWGRHVTLQGLRWGGGSPIDRKTGIPSDWNHVDAGPRQQ